MKFIIEESATENPKNVFILEVEVMHGDADKDEIITLGPFTKEQEKWMICAIETTERLVNTHDRDDYKNVEGYELWYSECTPEGMDYDDPIFETTGYLPRDVTCEDYRASVQYYNLYWYDEAGCKHKVKIEK